MLACHRAPPQLVDQFFNDSTGEGEHARGPWNEGDRNRVRELPLHDLICGTERKEVFLVVSLRGL
jgi:hypothetical protein